jgi:Heparinase II/III-like protein
LIDKTRLQSDLMAAQAPVPFTVVKLTGEFSMQILGVSRAILDRVVVHGFMYRYTGERRYADRLWREVDTALSYPTWNATLYLDAAEMMLAVGLAYDWAYDVWTPEQRARMRQTMKTNAIDRGLEIYETGQGPSAFFATTTSNWNSVCNSGLLAAALAMAEDEPELAQRVVSFASKSLNYPKQSFASGSAYEEGQSYWSYSADFFLLASELLKTALGSDAGLSEDAVFSKAALFRLHVRAPIGRNYTYADSWGNSNSHLGYAILAHRYGPQEVRDDVREQMALYLKNQDQETTSFRLYPLVYLWLTAPNKEATTTTKSTLSLDVFFTGSVHLAMMRSAWGDPKASYVGFKAGHIEHNHNHLDAGSFIMDSDGVRWSTDLGPDSYSLPGYFRKETNITLPINKQTKDLPNRWTYLRANNYGHSTLTLGRDLQKPDAFAPFVATGSQAKFAFSIADLSAVYPKRSTQWQRGIALVDRKWVAVRDELKGLQKNVTADWVMMTEANVEIDPDGRSATLTQQGESLKLRLAAAPKNARIHATPATPAGKDETKNEGVTKIRISWIAQQSDESIEVHLVPSSYEGNPGLQGSLLNWGTH